MKILIGLTEPTTTCITISPIPALVTRTDVAHPAQKKKYTVYFFCLLLTPLLCYYYGDYYCTINTSSYPDNPGCLQCRQAY